MSEDSEAEAQTGFPKTVYADYSHGVAHRVVNSQEELDDFLAQGWREDLGA